MATPPREAYRKPRLTLLGSLRAVTGSDPSLPASIDPMPQGADPIETVDPNPPAEPAIDKSLE